MHAYSTYSQGKIYFYLQSQFWNIFCFHEFFKLSLMVLFLCSAYVGNILRFYLKQGKNNLRYRIMLSGRMIAVIPGDNGLMSSNLFMVSKISLYFGVLSSSTEWGRTPF